MRLKKLDFDSSCGQLNGKGRSLAPSALHPDFSLVIGDDSVSDGKSEPGSLLLGGKIGLKDLGDIIGGNAPSRIRDLDYHMCLRIIYIGTHS